MIVAVAGRRIDELGAHPPRFPLDEVPLVKQRLRRLFETEAVRGVVSSAACGSDLLALTVAGVLGLRRRVILPFARARFRHASVTDRPGDWGPIYDRVLAELDPTRDVVTLEPREPELAAYAAVNHAILDQATTLARSSGLVAIAALVWEGAPRDGDDLTEAFGREAQARGLRVVEVRTSTV